MAFALAFLIGFGCEHIKEWTMDELLTLLKQNALESPANLARMLGTSEDAVVAQIGARKNTTIAAASNPAKLPSSAERRRSAPSETRNMIVTTTAASVDYLIVQRIRRSMSNSWALRMPYAISGMASSVPNA